MTALKSTPARKTNKKEIVPNAPDDLSLDLDREVIMVAGGPNSGKSYSVAKLIQDGVEQKFNVVVIDRDRGLVKAIKEVSGTIPDNLDYFLGKTWGRIEAGTTHAMNILCPGDWLVFEMIGSMWDFVQTQYAEMVYGDDLAAHILDLRIDAEARIQEAGYDVKSSEGRTKAQKERARSTGYSGLDGRQDWSLIKRMHNANVFDKAILQGDFNILSTTSLKPMDKDEMDKNKWPMWNGLSKRPEGEKGQVHRHDTIIVADKKDGEYLWRTDLSGNRGKERGLRELARDVNFTDVGVVASYLEYHNDA